MISAFLFACAGFGAQFELHSIPLESQSAKNEASPALIFFASADNDGMADLCVLEASVLSVHLQNGEVRENTLPPGVSVFDMSDLDGDGMVEIIAIRGRSILQIPLALKGNTPEPVRLFESDSLWSDTLDGPVPRVLVVEYEGLIAIAIPTMSGIVYFRRDGMNAGETPLKRVESNATTGRSFLADDQDGLELSYRAGTSFDSPMGKLAPFEGPLYAFTNFPYRPIIALRDAVDEEPNNWPWFVIHGERGVVSRAYCAVEAELVSVVRTCEVPVDDEGFPSAIATPGPARRYPGEIAISTGDFPDFNGDGYKDLLLWNAPKPGISVDALLRAVMGRDWPITLTMHLYSPSKGRYEPEATTTLTFRIPVTWFLNGPSPLRFPVFADFNGDKKTDLAMCTEEKEYGVWLYKDGFAAAPDEKHTFTESITGVELTADVAGNGKTSIVLRSDRYVYALYAK